MPVSGPMPRTMAKNRFWPRAAADFGTAPISPASFRLAWAPAARAWTSRSSPTPLAPAGAAGAEADELALELMPAPRLAAAAAPLAATPAARALCGTDVAGGGGGPEEEAGCVLQLADMLRLKPEMPCTTPLMSKAMTPLLLASGSASGSGSPSVLTWDPKYNPVGKRRNFHTYNYLSVTYITLSMILTFYVLSFTKKYRS